MLEEISWAQLIEWETYDTLEPFGEDRDDFRFASIVQALWNIHRDPKRYPNGFPLTDFVLMFGDAPREVFRPQQTVETQEHLIEAWCIGSNLKLAAREKGTQ